MSYGLLSDRSTAEEGRTVAANVAHARLIMNIKLTPLLRSNKGITAFVLCAVLLVAGVFALGMSKYYELEHYTGIKALWNQSNLYIFIGTLRIAERNKVYQRLLAKWFRLSGMPEHYNVGELRVYRLHDGEIAERVIESSIPPTPILPYKDTPDAFTSGIDPLTAGIDPLVYRWNGETFLPLGRDESKKIRSSFTSEAEVLSREGWSKLDWENIRNDEGNDQQFPIQMRDMSAVLSIQITRTITDADGYVAKRPRVTIALSVNGAPHTLLDLRQDAVEIGRNEYLRAKSAETMEKEKFPQLNQPARNTILRKGQFESH
jgi:hypothetical protein